MPKLTPPIVRIAFLALTAMLLPACASMPNFGSTAAEPDPTLARMPDVAEARSAWLRGDFVAASQAYERAALAQPASRAGDYWLAAAEAASAAKDPDRALQLAGRVPPNSFDAEHLGRLQIVRAESLLAKDQPYEAAKALPPSSNHLPQLATKIESLRARALFAGGEPVPAPAAAVVAAPQSNAGGAALLLPLSGNFAPPAEAV
ncbi:MAG TPA: hypothetical protein VLI06_05015, partial [Solimonas sp.]|nr:hypothetical protein [Solimonas sp.]